MPSARSFGMESVYDTILERFNRVFHESGLIQRVSVNHHLHVQFIRHAETAVDSCRRGAPVFMELKGASSGMNLLFKRRGETAVAFPRESQIHRPFVGRLYHFPDVPWTGRAGRRIRACRGSRSSAQHRCDAGGESFVDLLGTDEVYVAIEAAGGHNFSFTGDYFGRSANGN